MAEERDTELSQQVSQSYRELGAAEPSPEVEAAILAAARHPTDKPHAPLVVPSGRHRWYYSLTAVALLVLAIAVTLHIEREQPDPERAFATAPAPASQAAPEAASPSAAPPIQREDRARQERPTARLAEQTPERELGRIAELRRQGRDQEADKALAEFRKRYPDYRIPQAVLEKVERK